MDSYKQCIEALFSRRGGEENGISHYLSEQLSYPFRKYPTIHVAGTNGKGSTAFKIAKALELSGYRVGMMISPHIESYRERITINGEEIPEKTVVQVVSKLLHISEQGEKHPNFFHITTFLGFEYFAQQNIDVAVIETGIGGRLDPTNVVDPILSVITSIGLDHQAMLGPTLEHIAREKAGIIKPNKPVVVGKKARFIPIFEQAKAVHAPLIEVENTGISFDDDNTNTAKAALYHLQSQFSLNDCAIEKGCSLRPPCRYERHGRFVFDVAHNVDGFNRLCESLERDFPGAKYHVILGLKKDKNIAEVLKILETKSVRIDLIEDHIEEGTLFPPLKKELYRRYRSVEESIGSAVNGGNPVVICGRFSLMTPAKNALEKMSQSLAGSS